MRPEDIFDAVTDIRDDQIEFAKPRRSRRRYLVPIAACLVLALIALPFLSSRSPRVRPLYTGSAQLAKARYPGSPKDAEKSHDMPSSSGLPNGSPAPAVMYEGDETDGPYAEDSDGSGYGDTVSGSEDSSLWENIERGQEEYWKNREEYSQRLNGFWTGSAETFLTADNEENLIFSPISLYTVLGMSAELCEGEPQKEILDLLGSPGITDLRDSARRIWCESFTQGESTCLLANSLWLSNTVDYKQPVLDTLAENYFADSFRGDMGSEEYDLMHLDWLGEKTNGYLDGKLPGLESEPDTLMYLDSTIYFKARWYHEFDPSQNENGTFHSRYMDQPCTFMRETSWGGYYWGEHFSAIGKGLSGGHFMLFVLPDEGYTTNDLLADPEYKSFLGSSMSVEGRWEKSSYVKINSSIPKFDVTSDMDMAPGLREMGISGIFEGGTGSFAPITDRDFFFTGVKHACRVAIDEEGCEAAAVTVMPAAGSSGPPEDEVDFVLDRPFLFTITNWGGLPIYMGVVNQITE